MLSSKFVILAAVGFVAFVAAGPMGGGAMGGPFAELEKSLDETQKADLKAIFTKEGLTKQQIHDEIKAYFTKIGGDALTKFTELEGKMESMKTEMIQKADDATKNLSEPAQKLVEQVKSIKLDMSITPAEDRKQIKALFDAASEEVKTELKTLKNSLFGGHHEGHFFTTAVPASA